MTVPAEEASLVTGAAPHGVHETTRANAGARPAPAGGAPA